MCTNLSSDQGKRQQMHGGWVRGNSTSEQRLRSWDFMIFCYFPIGQ